MSETIACCLEDGEQIRHFAQGVRQPPLWAAFYFAFLDSSGRSIHRNSQWYLVAVTDRRLLILRYENKTMDFVVPDGPMKVFEQQAWPLTALPPIKVTPQRTFSHLTIEIGGPTKPLKIKFLGTAHMRPDAQAVVAALTDAA
jgi:hypothetical protein